MNRRQACVLCHTPIISSVPESELYRICRTCDITWCIADDPSNPADEWETGYYNQKAILQLHEVRRSGMVRIIARLSKIRPERGRLLDIGAGIGILMEVAARDGWTVEGVEPSFTAANRARQLTGATVHNGLLEEIELAESYYDAVTVLDILRSVPDPIKFLSGARRLLRPSGVLLIRESYRRVVRRSMWLMGKNSAHLKLKERRQAFEYAQCFSPKSLIFALSAVGLKGWVEPSPVFVESGPAGGFLSRLAKEGIGLASISAFKASGGRIIISPNLLAFGTAGVEQR